ncbi:PqqD family protein [bacterium]|nr:PqqD family protein [bacterium]
MNRLPAIRSDLGVTLLESELIVFDPVSSKAHCLNSVGARMFVACQAGTSVEDVRGELSSEEIDAALAELEGMGFLVEDSQSLGRRRFLERVGVGLASVVVASVAAPKPAAAASCVRCRLDTVTKFPCSCATCGQPCSIAAAVSCADPVSGPCLGGGSICCFEYLKSGAAPPVGEPACFNENLGDYGCRPVAPTFSSNCETARGLVANFQLYYCCCCSINGPLNRNCC